ncbi:hypothetical protein KP509_12G011300 [Ceratopteris richardii]|uniref:Cyanovirin-N domain-containing protein n=1 Tax=Ceratopteris richardii TaxID=49495 RepID=A0A8T2TLA9_CERRI|nr:hypothetical protein KP509_12G011300 [Ceratopteris richardii]
MALRKAELIILSCLVLTTSAFLVHACNYAASCADETLSGTTLTASCANIGGNPVLSSVNLDAKVSNNDGQLICPGADFSASCSNIGLSGGHTLVANCKNVNGALVQTSLDLNNCISNNDGTLQFCV